MLVRRIVFGGTAFLAARAASAQHVHISSCDDGSCVGASATLLVTRITAAGGTSFNEAYLTQPFVAASTAAWGGRFRASGIFNLEGYTLRRGELSPGTYGEGYVDRRHPHTHVHELMAGGRFSLGSVRLAISAGKGFVPFGSEDPMMRPFVRYPANHHLAQILERAQIVTVIRTGPVELELASFGGDEPEGAADWPNEDRFFDSWAGRATFSKRGLEVSASAARVKSPEHAEGFGLNQNKVAASLRYSGMPNSRIPYALIEWAQTTEWLGTRKDLWSFASALGELTVNTKVGRVALRLERTSRPEESRDKTPFRSVRPLLDFGIVGRTRWENATLGWAVATSNRRQVMPFAEVSVNRARPLERVVITSPADAFGGLRLFSISAGVRVGLGAMPSRMGRYGPPPPN